MRQALTTGSLRATLGAVSLGFLLGSTGIARAVDFEYNGITGSFDTTLTFGAQMRAGERDQRFIGSNLNSPAGKSGAPSGFTKPLNGTAIVPNHDDGDLNFANGQLTSALVQATHELSLKKENYGAFLRGSYFYDFINADRGASDFKPFSNDYRHTLGYDFRLLDAFVYGGAEIADHTVDVRVGNQVINWGESTFIQGVNQFAPLDLNALVQPGSELKQAILPVPAIDFKVGITPDLSFEGFYQFMRAQTRLFPSGGFFTSGSLVDYILPGGQLGQVGTLFPDAASSSAYPNALAPGGFASASEAFGAGVPTTYAHNGKDQGQFGLALRYTAPSLGDTEFGLYYEHYNSRLPIGSENAGSSAGAYASGAAFIAPGLIAAGVPLAALQATTKALFAPAGINPGTAANYLSTTSTFRDYVNAVDLIGASVNFVGPAGVAVQSEVTFKPNTPLQISASDLNGLLGAAATCRLAKTTPAFAAVFQPQCDSVLATPTAALLGFGPGHAPGFGEYIPGFRRFQVLQWQGALTKLFQDIPGTPVNSWSIIGELGIIHVLDFPSAGGGVFNSAYATSDHSAFNPVAGAGQPTSLTRQGQYQTPAVTSSGINYTPGVAQNGLASQTSAGYVILASFEIQNWLPYGIEMRPHVAWQHDISGISPGGAGFPGFQENAASVSLGVDFSYLKTINWGVQYTNHFSIGNSTYDGAIDRDFASVFASYSF